MFDFIVAQKYVEEKVVMTTIITKTIEVGTTTQHNKQQTNKNNKK